MDEASKTLIIAPRRAQAGVIGSLRGVAATAIALVVLFSAPQAGAQLDFSAPAALNSNADSGLRADFDPQIATDGQGAWVAVWTSLNGLGGTIGTNDWDILVSRSTDDGVTWTDPAALNNTADDDGEFVGDSSPQITTDGQGVWLAVWHSAYSMSGVIGTDLDILTARSTDNGATWTDPAPLNTTAIADTDKGDFWPQITTDGQGAWVAVWQSNYALGGPAGTEPDIFVARSADDGTTWTAATTLNSNSPFEAGLDQRPQVATDGLGAWVAVWFSSDSLGATIGTDDDILFARSTDDGANWSTAAPLNTTAFSDSTEDNYPQITTDGAGRWIAVWMSPESIVPAPGIHVSYSTDNGATWTAPLVASGNSGPGGFPQITTDGLGQWITVWHSNSDLGGTINTDLDILLARSTDGGVSWDEPIAMNANADVDSGDDSDPQIATDGAGAWVAVWHSQDSLGGAIGTDKDILFATATVVNASGPGWLIYK